MIKIEALTLEEAYQDAASSLKCSVTELRIEVIQSPSNGFLGMFKKSAIIVATKEVNDSTVNKAEEVKEQDTKQEPKPESLNKVKKEKPVEVKEKVKKKTKKVVEKVVEKVSTPTILNDTIMPETFVSIQDEDDNDIDSACLADYDDEEDEEVNENLSEIASTIEKEINQLFDFTCFNIDKIKVSVYDETTLLIAFNGDDAALLIGKEGYRYKALSYMVFNWINSKYQVQLRLEIAEFLKNQEEAIARYLDTVYETVEKEGRAQTKILDGVLIQIALRELRDKYHDKYVAIRSTRDGLKYIIINDYHSN